MVGDGRDKSRVTCRGVQQADDQFEDAVDEAVDVAVAEFTAHRAVIERAVDEITMAARSRAVFDNLLLNAGGNTLAD
jgi:hypothetical protein